MHFAASVFDDVLDDAFEYPDESNEDRERRPALWFLLDETIVCESFVGKRDRLQQQAEVRSPIVER